MRVLHVVPSLSPDWGGPVTVVINLTRALKHSGVQCSLVTTCGALTGRLTQTSPDVDVRAFQTDVLTHAWLGHAPGLASVLEGSVRRVDLVHIHELWHFPHWAACRAAQRYRVPYVVTPHGQLDPWMLSQKAWRKRIYAALLLRPSLRRAAALQALSAREAAQVRAFGVATEVYVIPNAVAPSAQDSGKLREHFYTRFPALRGRRVVLFLGRLHLQKGVDVLIEAFAAVHRHVPNAVLLLVGPADAGLERQLVTRARAMATSEATLFVGPLYGMDRDAALAAAAVFVLPSRAEGASVALLEAMAAGLPVIVTEQANSPDVSQSGAGLVVAPSPAELASAVLRVLGDAVLAERLGHNGRTLVSGQFTWDNVAEDVIQMYRRAAASCSR